MNDIRAAYLTLWLGVAGLYQARPEMDFSGDPIALGILTERDFERLVQLYFASMRPFLWLLLPQLHTPEYLRSTSPFLTTALAFAAATYDPLSAHFVARLDAHARSLATRIYYEGLKSLEIVQAYFFLSYVHLQVEALGRGAGSRR